MIYLDSNAKEPLYKQLYEQLKRKIIDGEYPKGKRLSATREMAKALCVGRNTVEAAYDQLCVEGYVTSRQGSGYVVQDILDGILEYPYKSVAKSKLPSKRNEETRHSTGIPQTYKYDFQYGNLSPHDFPHSIWRRLTADTLISFESKNINVYGDKQGEYSLRLEIVQYLQESRGINCVPEQVVVCSGHQDALGMFCVLLSDGNRTLAMEDPGYDFTRIIFENNGYTITPVPVDDCGIKLDVLASSSAKLVYTTPSHQFPLGMVMPIGHRMKLLQWAEQNGGIIIEDDYDSELRYHTRPVPALQSIDRHGRVIYLGTFSKALSPGLRMGYFVLPEWLLPKYHAIFKRYKSSVPWIQQQTMMLYMAGGHWERHLRKYCLANKKKRDILIHTIQEQMGNNVRILGDNAGLHILLYFLNGESQENLIEQARAYQVKVYPTRHLWHQQESVMENLIMVGFSGLSENEIVDGVNLLRQAWFGTVTT